MKLFEIEWETDFCEDYPERRGETLIEAETEEEAIKKFKALKIQKAIIFNIYERKS